MNFAVEQADILRGELPESAKSSPSKLGRIFLSMVAGPLLLRYALESTKSRRRKLTSSAERARMIWLIFKYFLTSAVVVAVSEFAKRSDRLGGLVAALPLVTLLTLVWLHVENQSEEKIANHAWYTFWYVVPTLPMFLAFPLLLPRIGFWGTFFTCIVITVACFWLLLLMVRKFGIELL